MNDSPKNHDDRLSDLLWQWEQRHRQGEHVTAAELCGECPELVSELEVQIRAIQSMDALLALGDSSESQPPDTADSEMPGQDAVPEADRHMATQSRYRVLRSHAQGGLGEVLLAEDELLGREVALKVIRRPHDRDPLRRRRFAQEAEITGRLEHPGVVPVHGIGQDSGGRLCYVMRMIRGESMQEAIRRFHGTPEHAGDERERSLGLRQLLARFLSVCNTVAYAHSQGVIHRDLKPANIMLGKFGETLVVDWGLAKHIRKQDDGAARTEPTAADTRPPAEPETLELTQHGAAIGTPAFMSPEQGQGRWHEVGTASDIYSLGATLYVILTGQPAITVRHVAEYLDRLRRGDFPPPRQVNRSVPKPLEAVCLKAMALDPAARYPSALALAADVENWLADLPVSAWREPVTLRLQRWIHRHRTLVTGMAAALCVGIVSLGLVAGLVAHSNRQLRTANDAERAAKQEADRNAQIADTQSALAVATLQTVVTDIQSKLKNLPAARDVRRGLLQNALDGLDQVAASLDTRMTVDRQTMLAHRDLGDLFLQVGSDGEVGGTEAAFRQYKQALDIAEKLVADFPRDPTAQRDLALAMSKLGDVCRELGSTEQSRHYYTQALHIRSKLQDTQPGDSDAMRLLALAFKQLGDLTRKSGSVDEALQYFQKSCEMREQLLASDPANPAAQRDLSVSLNAVGTAHLQLGSPDKALEYHTRALELDQRRAADAPDHRRALDDLAYSHNKIGDVLRHTGSFAEARGHYEKSLAVRQQLAADDPDSAEQIGSLIVPNERLGKLALHAGELDAALRYFTQQHTLLVRLTELDPVSVWNRRSMAVALDNIGDVHARASRNEEAMAKYNDAMTIREALAADPENIEAQSDLAASFGKMGDMIAKGGNTAEAIAHYERAVAIAEPIVATDPKNTVEIRDLAALYQRAGDAYQSLQDRARAAAAYDKMIKLLEVLLERNPQDTETATELAGGLYALGCSRQDAGDRAEALERFHAALRLLRPLDAQGKLNATGQARLRELEAVVAP